MYIRIRGLARYSLALSCNTRIVTIVKNAVDYGRHQQVPRQPISSSSTLRSSSFPRPLLLPALIALPLRTIRLVAPFPFPARVRLLFGIPITTSTPSAEITLTELLHGQCAPPVRIRSFRLGRQGDPPLFRLFPIPGYRRDPIRSDPRRGRSGTERSVRRARGVRFPVFGFGELNDGPGVGHGARLAGPVGMEVTLERRRADGQLVQVVQGNRSARRPSG